MNLKNIMQNKLYRARLCMASRTSDTNGDGQFIGTECYAIHGRIVQPLINGHISISSVGRLTRMMMIILGAVHTCDRLILHSEPSWHFYAPTCMQDTTCHTISSPVQ